MIPTHCNIPGLESSEIVIAKDQPEYDPLPALPIAFDGIPGLVTRWTLSAEERDLIARGADIWVSILTFGNPVQPMALSCECPALPVVEPS